MVKRTDSTIRAMHTATRALHVWQDSLAESRRDKANEILALMHFRKTASRRILMT